MSHRGFVSDWFDMRTIEDLLDILCEGDLLEFDRWIYRHWAVCVSIKNGAMVVHRSGTDCSRDLVIRSYSYNKQGHGVGAICKELLRDILSKNRVRINNSHDKEVEPKPVSEVVAFAKKAVGSDDFGEYNLLTNNCEHFAKLCRNDHKSSGQVDQAVLRGVAGAAGIIGTAFVVGVAVALFGKTDRKQKSHSSWQLE